MIRYSEAVSRSERAIPRTDVLRKPRKKLTDEEAEAFVEAKASTVQHGRDPTTLTLEKSWFINAVQYAGLQNFESFDLLQDIDPGILVEDTSYVANHILPVILSNISKKSKARPQWQVPPNSPDQQDQDGAKAAQDLLDFAYDHLDTKKIRRDIALYTECFGTAFIYIDWDHSAGDRVTAYRDPATQQPLLASELEPGEKEFLKSRGSFDEKMTGDWTAEAMLPFQVRVPIEFTSMRDMPWIVVERWVPMEWIWDRYPKKAPMVDPDEISAIEDNQWWRRLPTLVNRHGFTVPSRGESNNDSVLVQECWIPPSKLLTQGAKIVRTRNLLLENSPHPFHATKLDTRRMFRFPVVDIHNIRLPGRFHSMSTVEHLIGPQREYNRARTQLIQQRDTLANPQWLAPYGAKLDQTRNEYGDIWEYEGSQGKPELQNPPAISAHHVQTEERALFDLETIAASPDASRGQVPEGVRSGIALQSLQEKAEAVFGPSIEEIEDGFSEFGSKLLGLAYVFMSVPRAISIYGESRANDMILFKGEDLNGNIFARVKQSSMMPKSKSQAMSNMMELLQLGALNPADPNDRRLIRETVELGDIDRLFLMEDLDRRRARIENRMFHKPVGNHPDVHERDDHQAHVEEHLLFMKTDAYERLPAMRKLAFESHLMKHEMAVAQKMEAMVAFQQAQAGPAAGPAPPGGGGSPPKQPGEASRPAPKQPTPGTSPGRGE